MNKTATNKDSKQYKIFLFCLILLYFGVGCTLFCAFFTSINSVECIIINSQFWSSIFSVSISEQRNTIIIISIALAVILTVIFFILKVLKKFPPAVTIVALGFNSIVCIVVKSLFYILDKFDVFFDFQVLNVLPLITIILSLVFLIYDYIDYSFGTYNPRRAETRLPSEQVVQETMDLISRHSKNSSQLEKAYTDEMIVESTEEDNKAIYRTEEGFFNNEALEMAADQLFSSIEKEEEKKTETNHIG